MTSNIHCACISFYKHQFLGSYHDCSAFRTVNMTFISVNVFLACNQSVRKHRGGSRLLIGGGGAYSHIQDWLTNFFWNKVYFKRNKSGKTWIYDYVPKAGESRGRAPGQASDYTLRAPNPLDSSPMTRCFIKISGPQTSLGPRYFAPPLSRRPCMYPHPN